MAQARLAATKDIHVNDVCRMIKPPAARRGVAGKAFAAFFPRHHAWREARARGETPPLPKLSGLKI